MSAQCNPIGVKKAIFIAKSQKIISAAGAFPPHAMVSGGFPQTPSVIRLKED